MKNKKKLFAIIAVVLAVSSVIAFALTYGPYKKDANDTEDLYNSNIAIIGYENTVETAIPQTELYSIITEHYKSELPDGKTEKKAIIIGYDGCRADILAVKSEENSAVSSLLKDGASINLTYCGGVNYPEKNTQDTSTAPGWCSILTGQWADVHAVTGNDIPKSMEAKTLMTTLTEDGTIGSASFITKWAGHFTRKNATYLPEVDYCNAHALPVTFTKCDDDAASHQEVLAEINDEACSDFIIVIYEPTDSIGHSRGFSFNNPEYQEAFLNADAYGYETIEAIKARPTYDTEDWLIIVTSDHGGIKTNHGKESIQERMTFVVMNKQFPSAIEKTPLTNAQAVSVYNEAYTVASLWFDFYNDFYDTDDYFNDNYNSYYAVNHESINSVAKLKNYLSRYFSKKLIDSIVDDLYVDKNGKLYQCCIEAGDHVPTYYLDETKAELISQSDESASYSITVTTRYNDDYFDDGNPFREEDLNISYVYENGRWVIDNHFAIDCYGAYKWNKQ